MIEKNARFLKGYYDVFEKRGKSEIDAYVELVKLAAKNPDDFTLGDMLIEHSTNIVDNYVKSADFRYIKSRFGSPSNMVWKIKFRYHILCFS